MQSYATIEIDLSLHKLIERERSSFEETANSILHRLLESRLSENHDTIDKEAASWMGQGVVLPHGTRLRMSYNGHQHTAEIVNGKWLVDGDYYGSPSAAAYAVARTSSGEPARLNGWIYWEYQKPGGSFWARLEDLRTS